MTGATDGERLTRYLLGELPPDEAEAVESECFNDDEAQAALEAADDDLVDAFVRGTLPPERQRAFEARHAASPALRDKVQFSRALLRMADEHASSLSPASHRRTIAWVTAAGLAAAAIAWIASDPRAVHREREAVRLASFTLTAGTTRDLTGTVLRLPSDAAVVQLHLLQDGPPPQPPLAATIQTAEGGEVWSARGLAVRSGPGGAVVTLNVGAEHLPPGDYVATLSRIDHSGRQQEVASYSFETER